MNDNYTELKETYEDDEVLEIEEKKESKIKGFVKKHWKKGVVALGLGAAFIAGKCLGAKSSDDDLYELDELVPDSTEVDGPAATE